MFLEAFSGVARLAAAFQESGQRVQGSYGDVHFTEAHICLARTGNQIYQVDLRHPDLRPRREHLDDSRLY